MGAHVTLFHALPGRDEDEVLEAVRDAADRPAFDVQVDRLQSLGRGVAYGLRSPDLGEVHAGLARRFAGRLTPQDGQRFSPHVTVSNKTSPADARLLLERLRDGFSPYSVTAEGLATWRYVGGPWEHLATASFAPRGTMSA